MCLLFCVLTQNCFILLYNIPKIDYWSVKLMKKFCILVGIYVLICLTSCKCPCSIPGYKEGVGIAYSSDGAEIVFEAKGLGDVSLIFLHGWSCDRSYWRNQIKYFSKNYRVVTVDLAGHGSSGLTRRDYTIEAFSDDVVAVIEKLQLKDVIVIGHSMSGYVAIEVAKKNPDKIRGIIPVDTLQNVEAKFPKKLIDELIDNMEKDFSEATKNFANGFFPTTCSFLLKESIVYDMSLAPKKVGISAFKNLVSYNDEELLKRLNGFSIPVISINTDLSPTNEKINRAYFGSYKLMLMKGLGHFPMLEDSTGFNDNLEFAITDLINN